ncbi:MAG: M20/M25/M40 family metallo-hydrolase [bacterium]
MNSVFAVDQERILRTFLELVEINAPSFGEQEIAHVLAQKLEQAGCRVEIQDYGRALNIIASKKGRKSGMPILLSGHMDTVEPAEGVLYSIEDGIIRTKGPTVLGADDKSALAQIIEAITLLEEKGIPHGDIEIVFTSAEEKGLHGAKNLDFKGLKSRHALILDSSGPVGNLVIAAPTHLTYEMKVIGKSAHAGIEPEKGLSAIKAAAEIIANIPDGRINEGTTANIGMIHGGTATNVVPREVSIHGEMRSLDQEDLMRTKKTIFDTARTIAKKRRVRLDIREEEEYRAFQITENDSFIQFLCGVYTVCGIEPSLVVSGGGSDANVFNGKGIKAVNISNGMQKVHSNDEFIAISDLVKGALIVLKVLTEFPGFREERGV